MRGAALVGDADGGRDGKRGGAKQIGISILLVRESLIDSMRRLLSQDRSLVRHVGDGLAHSVGRILYGLRRLSRHRRRLVAYTGGGDAGRTLRIIQAIGRAFSHGRSSVSDIRGSIARDIAYIAQSPRSSLHHGRRRFGNLRCRRACGIPCFGAPILNLVLDDIGQFAGTCRQPRLARVVSVDQTGILVMQAHIEVRVAYEQRPQQAHGEASSSRPWNCTSLGSADAKAPLPPSASGGSAPSPLPARRPKAACSMGKSAGRRKVAMASSNQLTVARSGRSEG